ATMWSISNGTCEPVWGRRQYSQRSCARCRTNRSSWASMLGRLSGGLFQTKPGRGMHKVEEGAHPKIALEFRLFDRAECVVLVPDDELMQPFQVPNVQPESEQGFRGFLRQVSQFGMHETRENRRL